MEPTNVMNKMHTIGSGLQILNYFFSYSKKWFFVGTNKYIKIGKKYTNVYFIPFFNNYLHNEGNKTWFLKMHG